MFNFIKTLADIKSAKLTKKYKISFSKVLIEDDKVVSDSYIVSLLKDLQIKYCGFEIIKIDLRGYYDTSNIEIKCRKNDSCDIFTDFCSASGKYIRNIRYREM